MSQQNNIKRSQKTDFNTSSLMRERSFMKTSKEHQKRRSQTMLSIRPHNNKPTMEIYRPPNVRTDIPLGKLNVHAKEFQMDNRPYELQSSKSTRSLMNYEHQNFRLQQSKSSGNILKNFGHPGFFPIIPTPMQIPLMHSASHAQLLNHHFNRLNLQHQFNNEILANHPIFTGHNNQQTNFIQNIHNHNTSNGDHLHKSVSNQNLKRSKSLGASDSQNLANKLRSFPKEDADLGSFSPEDQNNLKLAVEDPNQLPSRTLMELVKIIMDRVVEGMRYSEAGAKLCIAIIEREKNQTYLETLLNTCQQWYQERDCMLRGLKAGDGTRFTAFMWFLTEMCGQLKRHQLKGQYESLEPEVTLLSILAKCCQACVSLPIKCLTETECLFFVLTSIGRDLETELPQQLEQLMANVRDGFLASAGAPAVRRTLLQLIELHASNWQLAGSSVLYYYPRIK